MSFEFDGRKYQKASVHQKEWGNEMISMIFESRAEKGLTEEDWILDLGCGDGVLTKELLRLVPHGKVFGIDASLGMIESAKPFENEQLTFRHMNINDLDFEDSFQLIFSNAALHWVKDHRMLLVHCYRALKEKGWIQFNFAGEGNCSTFFDVVRLVMAQKNFEENFRSFEWPWYMPSREDYQKLFETLGLFKTFEVTEENKDRFFKNSDEIIRWIDQPSLVPFLAVLPESLKAAFRQQVIDEMLKRTTQADGTCFETFRRICVTAEK